MSLYISEKDMDGLAEYFKKTVSENGEALEKFCNALKDGNSEVVEQSLNNYLKRTISIRDTFVKKQMKAEKHGQELPTKMFF